MSKHIDEIREEIKTYGMTDALLNATDAILAAVEILNNHGVDITYCDPKMCCDYEFVKTASQGCGLDTFKIPWHETGYVVLGIRYGELGIILDESVFVIRGDGKIFTPENLDQICIKIEKNLYGVDTTK